MRFPTTMSIAQSGLNNAATLYVNKLTTAMKLAEKKIYTHFISTGFCFAPPPTDNKGGRIETGITAQVTLIIN